MIFLLTQYSILKDWKLLTYIFGLRIAVCLLVVTGVSFAPTASADTFTVTPVLVEGVEAFVTHVSPSEDNFIVETVDGRTLLFNRSNETTFSIQPIPGYSLIAVDDVGSVYFLKTPSNPCHTPADPSQKYSLIGRNSEGTESTIYESTAEEKLMAIKTTYSSIIYIVGRGSYVSRSKGECDFSGSSWFIRTISLGDEESELRYGFSDSTLTAFQIQPVSSGGYLVYGRPTGPSGSRWLVIGGNEDDTELAGLPSDKVEIAGEYDDKVLLNSLVTERTSSLLDLSTGAVETVPGIIPTKKFSVRGGNGIIAGQVLASDRGTPTFEGSEIFSLGNDSDEVTSIQCVVPPVYTNVTLIRTIDYQSLLVSAVRSDSGKTVSLILSKTSDDTESVNYCASVAVSLSRCGTPAKRTGSGTYFFKSVVKTPTRCKAAFIVKGPSGNLLSGAQINGRTSAFPRGWHPSSQTSAAGKGSLRLPAKNLCKRSSPVNVSVSASDGSFRTHTISVASEVGCLQ